MLIDQVSGRRSDRSCRLPRKRRCKYYAKHPEEFTDPASVTLREIFIEVRRRQAASASPKTTRSRSRLRTSAPAP
jgi:hypothetical protein